MPVDKEEASLYNHFQVKKSLLLRIFIVLGLPFFLLAQNSFSQRTGLKYDYRAYLKAAPVHNFDILHYHFDWEMNFNTNYLQGKAIIRSRSLSSGLNTIILHLDDNMQVTHIIEDQAMLAFSHHDDLLEIYRAQSSQQGQLFEIDIIYHGFPQSGLYLSTHENNPIIWSLDEPIGARNWFPCYDLPSDKATVEMHITVPSGITAASNGTLAAVDQNPDGTLTFVWQEDYPIATYLISVAATNYSTFSDLYATGSDSMEVQFYVYPESRENAQRDFVNTVSMIDFYSQVFGEYPFFKEKYGMAEIPGGTAMEHQTLTSYPSGAIDGAQTHDWLIAHELAHHWWGDSLTPEDWPDIWLNEGFATYSDALWQEHVYGFEGLKYRMASFKDTYFTRHSGPEHPIYDPPEGHLFCTEEYQKAAWVLHMLRFAVGEKNFWEILKTYALNFAYSTVTTADFQSVCENIYGSSLDWFFEQWIFGPGFPSYAFGWGRVGTNQVRVIINQVQTDFPLFKMPIELQILLPSGAVKRTVWVEQENNDFILSFSEKPLDVLFDPDVWILCTWEKFYKKGRSGR